MSTTDQDAENRAKLEQEQIRYDEIRAKVLVAEQKVTALTSEYAAAMADDSVSEADRQQKSVEVDFAKAALSTLVENHKNITLRLSKAKAKLLGKLLKATDLTRIDTHYTKNADKDGNPVIYTASHPDDEDTVEDDKLRRLAGEVRKHLAIIPEIKDRAKDVDQDLVDMTVALTCAVNGSAVRKKVQEAESMLNEVRTKQAALDSRDARHERLGGGSADGAEERKVMLAAMHKLLEDKVTRESRSSGSRKLLSFLPTFSSATSDFLDHALKLKTYHQLNCIDDPMQRKLLLIASLDDEARLRITSIDPNVDPFDSMDYEKFVEEIRAAYLPKSHQKNYRAMFKDRVQKSAESPFTYMQSKFTLFGRGYTVHSFSWFLEQSLEKLFNHHLRSEMHRACANIDCEDMVTTGRGMRITFNKVMDTLNSAIDLVARLHPGHQQGLNLATPGIGRSSVPGLNEFTPSGEEGDEEIIEEIGPPAEGEEEGPLTQEEIVFCEELETVETHAFYTDPDGPAEEAYIAELASQGKKKCWVCDSSNHLKHECPSRMVIAKKRLGGMNIRATRVSGSRGRGRGSASGRPSRGRGTYRGRGTPSSYRRLSGTFYNSGPAASLTEEVSGFHEE